MGFMMAEQSIRFDDGAGYEQMMGKWSQLVGSVFLDWVSPAPGLRWIDVGCGNGAFTDMIAGRCSPAAIDGIDPSEGQLAYARTRPGCRLATFRQGDAMALPYPDKSFDIAVMALVMFFVPDPMKGATEMMRVVKPGGTACAYVWDILHGGFPLDLFQEAMRDVGMKPLLPPSVQISPMQALRGLWVDAGLDVVETREISVQRSFSGFDEYWQTSLLGSSIGPKVASMPDDRREELKSRLRARLRPDSTGQVTIVGRANAVKGRVPA